MKKILGISAYYHDSAAALLVDGKIVAAAQEERFTRIKHDASLPVNAIDFCLKSHGIDINELDAIVFYEKPFQKFGRILESHRRNVPKGFMSFRSAIKSWLREKLWIPKNIQKSLQYDGPVFFCDHHESHAASAFFSSPFDQALIVVIDAVGEKSCTSLGKGFQNKIEPLLTQEYPHSLGLFYSAFTYYCGFKVNSGEYKLMGLAPYGEPKYTDLLKEHFIQIHDDGSIFLPLANYGFDAGLKMLSKKGLKHLSLPVRKSETTINQYYKDIAASVQQVLEEAVIKIVEYGIKTVSENNIVLAGGVALNCVANQKLALHFPDKNFWIQPAAGDAGGAVGAAQAFYFQNNERLKTQDSPQQHVYLGPSFSGDEIENTLTDFGANYKKLDGSTLSPIIANYLFEEKIVGWFQGRMEFGPRALGNRSILASPIPQGMKSRLNQAIKKREGFRPFAPVVLEEEAFNWFEAIKTSKYMLQTHYAKNRAQIPTCVHEDNTARVQTVSVSDNLRFYELIRSFHQLSGVPIIINTSFNLRGEPIVCTPEDAINCFIGTEMDILVIEGFVLLKSENQHIKPSKNVIRILD